METINFNAPLCSFKAVARELYEVFKATCKNFNIAVLNKCFRRKIQKEK